MEHRPFKELVDKMSPMAQEEIKRGTADEIARLEETPCSFKCECCGKICGLPKDDYIHSGLATDDYHPHDYVPTYST